MLTTIFEKLTRADLERLQLVSQQFRNIILQSDELPLRLLKEVQFTTLDNHWDYCARRCTLVLGVGNAKCLQGCAVRKLEYVTSEQNILGLRYLWIFRFRTPISSEDCTLLLDAKPAWKNAFVSVSVYRFTSPATRTAALTDILFCKKLRVTGCPERSPHSFMHLPAIRSCNHLDMRWISFTLKKGWPLPEPTGVIEWLEHEPAKEWDEPRQIELWAGDHCDVKVVDALKKVIILMSIRLKYTYQNFRLSSPPLATSRTSFVFARLTLTRRTSCFRTQSESSFTSASKAMAARNGAAATLSSSANDLPTHSYWHMDGTFLHHVFFVRTSRPSCRINL